MVQYHETSKLIGWSGKVAFLMSCHLSLANSECWVRILVIDLQLVKQGKCVSKNCLLSSKECLKIQMTYSANATIV